MTLEKLSIFKTVFIKHHVWYLTIATVKGEKGFYWSFHDRTGMPDEQAKRAFEREHYKEVSELIANKIKNDLRQQFN